MVKNISLSGGLVGSGAADDTGRIDIYGHLRLANALQVGKVNNLWYPVFSTELPDQYNDANLTLYVSDGYHSRNEVYGILHISLRINQGSVTTAGAQWEYAGYGINPAEYVIAHKKSNGKISAVLYTRIRDIYRGRSFVVLVENTTTGDNSHFWIPNKISSNDARVVASIPAEYSQVPSVLGTLQNPVSSIGNLIKTVATSSTITNGELIIKFSAWDSYGMCYISVSANDGTQYINIVGASTYIFDEHHKDSVNCADLTTSYERDNTSGNIVAHLKSDAFKTNAPFAVKLIVLPIAREW